MLLWQVTSSHLSLFDGYLSVRNTPKCTKQTKRSNLAPVASSEQDRSPNIPQVAFDLQVGCVAVPARIGPTAAFLKHVSVIAGCFGFVQGSTITFLVVVLPKALLHLPSLICVSVSCGFFDLSSAWFQTGKTRTSSAVLLLLRGLREGPSTDNAFFLSLLMSFPSQTLPGHSAWPPVEHLCTEGLGSHHLRGRPPAHLRTTR